MDRQSHGIQQPLKFILAIAVILGGILLTVLISLFLYGRVNTRHMPDESNVQEREVEKRLAEQRKLLIRTLDEKYHEDIISYQDMAKRLELEKKKVRTLETDLRSKKE